MMMQSHRRRNSGLSVHGRIVAGVFLCVLFFGVDTLFQNRVLHILQGWLVPVMRTAQDMSIGKVTRFMHSTQTLIDENEQLKNKIAELEQQLKTENILNDDVARFCTLLQSEGVPEHGAGSAVPFALPTVPTRIGRIVHYSQWYFGTVIVALTSDEKPAVHDLALDEGNVPFGYVSEVTGSLAYVTLFTQAQSEVEVRIHGVVTKLHGKSSNTLVGALPQEVPVAVGNLVTHTASGLPLGEVVRIENTPADPQSLVFVRPLATISETRFVRFLPAGAIAP